MKRIFIVLLICPSLYSQPNTNERLDAFMNSLWEYYDAWGKNDSFTLSSSEASNLAKEAYFFYSYHWRDISNYNRSPRKGETKPFKYGFILSHLLDKAYGKHFTQIIRAPYYLKTRVLDINPGIYVGLDGYDYNKTVLTCEILEVIKGAHIFNAGDTIFINYLTYWGISKSFVIGNTYFIPTKPWNCRDDSCEYGLNLFSENPQNGPWGVYEIKDDQISDAEYFQIPYTDWDSFKKEFQHKYIEEVIK